MSAEARGFAAGSLLTLAIVALLWLAWWLDRMPRPQHRAPQCVRLPRDWADVVATIRRAWDDDPWPDDEEDWPRDESRVTGRAAA